MTLNHAFQILFDNERSTCGSYSRACLIYQSQAILRVLFEGGPHSRAGLFQGFTVLSGVNIITLCANKGYLGTV